MNGTGKTGELVTLTSPGPQCQAYGGVEPYTITPDHYRTSFTLTQVVPWKYTGTYTAKDANGQSVSCAVLMTVREGERGNALPSVCRKVDLVFLPQEVADWTCSIVIPHVHILGATDLAKQH